jgi:hypothetical protein
MTEPVQWLALGASLLLLIAVIELVRRRVLAEEYSFLWIALSVALLAISARKSVLDVVAGWLGVHYPPSVLLLVMIPLGFVGAMFFSVVVSKQRKQIERLVEDTAILSAELRELKAKGDGQRPGPSP